MSHRSLGFIMSDAESSATPNLFLLLPLLSCLPCAWLDPLATRRDETSGVSRDSAVHPPSDWYHVLLMLPPLSASDAVLSFPRTTLHPAVTSSRLRWLQQAPVRSTEMQLLSCFFRRTCLKQGSDYPNPFSGCHLSYQLKSKHLGVM